MPACSFTIPFEGAAEKILIKARFAVESQGGSFNGNSETGNFDVNFFGNTIAGMYTVDGQNLDIIITSKPFLVPCSAIEGFLKNQVSK